MVYYLRQIGGIAFMLGILAVVLNFINMVPRLLLWIYTWGEGTAWLIKIAFIVVGALLWAIGYKISPQPPVETDMNPESLK